MCRNKNPLYNTFMIKLGAQELRNTQAQEEHKQLVKRNPIYIVVDNVLDTYNVGAIFRLADAVAEERGYLLCWNGRASHSPSKNGFNHTTKWGKCDNATPQ